MTTLSLATFALSVWIWIGLGMVVFVTLFFITAPYGRHLRTGWGPMLSARFGWCLMESPAPLLVGLGLAMGSRPLDTYSVLLSTLFLAHYVNRAIIFPLRLPSTSRPIPLSIVIFAFCFNLINGAFQGVWLGELAPMSMSVQLTDLRIMFGVGLFLIGAAINLQSDATLRALKRTSLGGYSVPKGGLFRYVSCPNYLGEIVEWTGFSLAMWALPGFAFLAWTLANLVPRALEHHRWYQANFPDYPPSRRALLPFLF